MTNLEQALIDIMEKATDSAGRKVRLHGNLPLDDIPALRSALLTRAREISNWIPASMESAKASLNNIQLLLRAVEATL